MTDKLLPPKKKNPQLRQLVPTLPPQMRSRAALGLTSAAARGSFLLQHCEACGAVQYPPRDACCACLSVELAWLDTPRDGVVIAETRIHASPDPYYRERLPWRSGLVQLAAGPTVLCHLHGDVGRGDTIRMDLKARQGGQGVDDRAAQERSPDMEERSASCARSPRHPKHRRVLITTSECAFIRPLIAPGLFKAGASQILVGEVESWRRGSRLHSGLPPGPVSCSATRCLRSRLRSRHWRRDRRQASDSRSAPHVMCAGRRYGRRHGVRCARDSRSSALG